MGVFHRYKDKAGEWRWHFKAANGKILADSGEGYNNLTDCDAAIAIIKRDAPAASLT